jgi:hypothetical protein
MICIQTIFLVVYQFVDQPRLATTSRAIVGTTIQYTETRCTSTSNVGAMILLIMNVLMLLNGIRLVFIGKDIPSQFNDGKVMAIMVSTMALLLLVVFTGSLFVNDPRFLFLLLACSTLLIVVSSVVVHTIPKLIQRTEDNPMDSLGINTENGGKRCKNCGYVDPSMVNGFSSFEKSAVMQ